MVDYREDNRWTVYIHISPSNKYYVGITSREPEERWGKGGYGYFGQKHFWNAIQKYGWNNFRHEIIASNLTKEEACDMEKKLISSLNSYNPDNGYNKTLGGEGSLQEFEDLSGKEFGYLKVLGLSRDVGKNGERKWECLCNRCGEKSVKYENVLKSGTTISCGCYRLEQKSDFSKTHGKSYESIYRKYIDMKQKCYSPNNSNYKYYGEKGFLVCNEWLEDFMVFYNWSITNDYDDEKILVVVDNSKIYSPDTCSWVTKDEFDKKYRGKSLCKYIEYNGEVHSLKEWAFILEINYATLKSRLKKLSVEEAFANKRR